MLPDRQVFDEALAKVRLPRPTVVNGTVSGIDLHIGSDDVNPDQAIKIPIKYSKATMKARPPSLSKAWKAAVDLQGPQPGSGNYRDMGASQLMASVNQQSQGSGSKLDPSDIAAMISAEVKSHSTYVVKKQDSVNPTQGTQATQGSQAAPSQKDPDFVDADADQEMDVIPEEAEDEYVSKEDIVKAWRFGSTWVPMEADMFEPLVTNKGVEILNLIPTANVRQITMRHLLTYADQAMASDWGGSIRLARHHLGQSADSVCVPHRGNEKQEHVRGGTLGAQRPSRACHWYLCTHA
jgi:ATP-dependent DNA helicase 2 subunit 2